jgi:enoyl-CoA hydratase
MSRDRILREQPAEGVLRLVLNRPDKRNAIDNALRGELLEALQEADGDDSIRVTILRGAGSCFSSGYDLTSDLNANSPYFSPAVGQPWARQVSQGWLSLWDLAKPVIAQVHGYAMAGGLELVGACDLVYAAEDARFSHPVTRFAGLPDFPWFAAKLETRHAMELHLTGREFVGEEAVRVGIVNQLFAADQLENGVLEIAQRMATSTTAVLAVQKRYVYTALEARGGRALVRTGNDLAAGPHMQALTNANPESILARVKGERRSGGESGRGEGDA